MELAPRRTPALAMSLRVRILLAIGGSLFFVVAVALWVGATRIHQMSMVQVEHEGQLFSNALEAAIGNAIDQGDIAEAQRYIDALVATRPKNDIEINVLLLRGDKSETVASNDRGNVKVTDEEEHAELLEALSAGNPSILVNEASPVETEEDAREENDPKHPNHYLPAGSRYLSLTTPLMRDGHGIGCINVVLSLRFLDAERASLIRACFVVLGIGLMFLGGYLVPFLSNSMFRPLNQLAREMSSFGLGQEIGLLVPSRRRDEIGVLQREFYSMVARIRSDEAMREELARARAERREQELLAKLRQAQKMEALGTLAGGIAHDFNNILTPILAYTELCRMKLNPESGATSYLGEITKAAHRARDLVGQILTFSRKVEPERAAFAIGPVVEETYKLLQTSQPANVVSELSLEEGVSPIAGNSGKIHQVVLNLMTNARQAMADQGGRLAVSVTSATLVEERFLSHSRMLGPGRYAKLSVADSGQGIPPDMLDRIFEPYFTTKADGEGTGLGLAMVHGIVEEANGGIDVRSVPGKGTTFDVYFPAADGSSGASSFPSAA